MTTRNVANLEALAALFDILFGANWRLEDGSYNDPAAAAEALRRLAKGHTIEEVTDPSYYCFHEAPDEQSTI
jgi:hypothetical protein